MGHSHAATIAKSRRLGSCAFVQEKRPMRSVGAKMVITAAIALAVPANSLHAQFVPPAGYLDKPGLPAPPVAPVAEPGAPKIEAVTDDSLAGMFSVVPGYPKASAHVTIV